MPAAPARGWRSPPAAPDLRPPRPGGGGAPRPARPCSGRACRRLTLPRPPTVPAIESEALRRAASVRWRGSAAIGRRWRPAAAAPEDDPHTDSHDGLPARSEIIGSDINTIIFSSTLLTGEWPGGRLVGRARPRRGPTSPAGLISGAGPGRRRRRGSRCRGRSRRCSRAGRRSAHGEGCGAQATISQALVSQPGHARRPIAMTATRTAPAAAVAPVPASKSVGEEGGTWLTAAREVGAAPWRMTAVQRLTSRNSTPAWADPTKKTAMEQKLIVLLSSELIVVTQDQVGRPVPSHPYGRKEDRRW